MNSPNQSLGMRPGRSRPLPALATVWTTVLIVAGLTGCTEVDGSRLPAHPTQGTITFEGQPIPGAFLVLHPQDEAASGNPTATAHVQSDGTFAVSTYDSGDGAPAGDYVVTVQWSKLLKFNGEVAPGPNILPQKYSNPATSGVIVHVAEGDNTLAPITLRR